MKISPVGAKLLHVDGQTDVTELMIASRNFTSAPKKAQLPHSHAQN
jgi:hypothetical protein